MVPKASQSRKNDFLKTELSFESGANFQREGQAKPSQKDLAKPGQAMEGLLGPTGEVSTSGFWPPEAFTPPLRMGPPSRS